jgi:uncharacterized membrane protein
MPLGSTPRDKSWDRGPLSGYSHGFLLDNGNYSTLDLPGDPKGINASGQIVGSYYDGVGGHGFLFDNGRSTTFDVPGATWTEAHGINDSGQIVGTYIDAGGRHGFLASPVP